MKVNDALVTFEELSTMGFPVKAGTNPPINNKCVTKGEVNTYYTVDTTVSPFSTYTDNRCPRFQDLVAVACDEFVPIMTQTIVSPVNGQVITPDCTDEFVYKFQISAGAATQKSGGAPRFINYVPSGIEITSFRYVYYDGKAIGTGANDWPLPTSDYYEVVTLNSSHIDIAFAKPIGNGHTYTVAFNARVTGGGATYTNIASFSGLGCNGLVTTQASSTFTLNPTSLGISITTDQAAISGCITVKRYIVNVTNSGCKVIGGTLAVDLPNGLYLDAFEKIFYDDQFCPLPTSDYYTLDTYQQNQSGGNISVTLKKPITSDFNYTLFFYATSGTADHTVSASITSGTFTASTTNTSSYTTIPSVTYYQLNGCSSSDYAFTTIVPLGLNNRYVLPTNGAVYIYGGATSTQCTVPPAYNGSIQRTNSYNCCDDVPNWQNNGTYNCYGTCDKYYVQTDIAGPCSSTNGQTRQGSVYQYNSPDCGGCCGQSTSQIASINSIGTYHTCSNGTVNQSSVYINENTCYGGPYIYLLNGTWLSYNPSNSYPSTVSNCQDTGSAYCQGSNWVINQSQANPCSSASCGVRVIEYNSVGNGCYTPPSCIAWRMENYNGYGQTDYIEWTDCNNYLHSEWLSDGSFLDICFKDGTSVTYSYSTPSNMGTC